MSSQYHVIWTCNVCGKVWADQDNGDVCTMTPECSGTAVGFAVFAGPLKEGDDDIPEFEVPE